MRRLYSVIAVTASCLLPTLSAAQPLRVRLNPSNIRLLDEPDFHSWTVESGAQNSSTSIGDDGAVSFALAAPADSSLEGDYDKAPYTRFVPHLGERVVAEGITTSGDDADDDAPGPLTLSIRGLEAGEHTLLAWHNTWVNLDAVVAVSVAVDGEEVASVRARLLNQGYICICICKDTC